MTPWDSVAEKLIFAVPLHNSPHPVEPNIYLFIYLRETPLNITHISKIHLISSFRVFSVLLNGLFTLFFSVNG